MGLGAQDVVLDPSGGLCALSASLARVSPAGTGTRPFPASASVTASRDRP